MMTFIPLYLHCLENPQFLYFPDWIITISIKNRKHRIYFVPRLAELFMGSLYH